MGNGAQGLVIGLEHQSTIEALLAAVMEKTSASLVVLATQDGQLVAMAGEHDGLDHAALSTLVAAELAASQELAAMVDDRDSCQAILREGVRHNLMILDVGNVMVLLVVVPRVQTIGWVRVIAREAAIKLAEVASAMGRLRRLDGESAPGPLAQHGLGDALDKIWVDGDVH